MEKLDFAQWSRLVKTDVVLLSRSMKPIILIPSIGVYIFLLIKYYDLEGTMFISMMLALVYLGVFESMFTRSDNEYLNYSLAAVNALAVVSAKNMSSMLLFTVSFVFIILFAGLLATCRLDWLVENCVTCIVLTPLLLISGNIQSERRITRGMKGVSMLNALTGVSIIMTGILLYKSICVIWNTSVGLLTCGIIYYLGYIASLRETAILLKKDSTSLMEMN